MFGVLRESTGKIQLLCSDSPAPSSLPSVSDTLKDLPAESVVCVEGVVRARPQSERKEAQRGGDIEVWATLTHTFLQVIF